MRFCAIFLSLFFLGLNTLPCDDAKHMEETNLEQISMDQPGEADHCTPFCQCHCCHVHVIRLDFKAVDIIEPETDVLVLQRKAGKSQRISISLFQPPRV